MRFKFAKMHGAGNDFVMLNGIQDDLPSDLSAFSKEICHRQFGIGADQVLIAYPSDKCDFRMDIYNADGGRVEMCGNGIRAFAKYVRDLQLTEKTEFTVETLAGPIIPQIIENHEKATANTVWVKVDMGEPELNGPKIPVNAEGQIVNHQWSLQNREGLLPTDPKVFNITTVSMGNPHCVIFVDDLDHYPVERIGSKIENDPFFPNRVNVEFIEVLSRSHFKQRTWERGSGETFACGTGASAVAVAGVLNDRCDRNVTISLKGGDLDLVWDEKTNHVYKTGPATTVFWGEWTT